MRRKIVLRMKDGTMEKCTIRSSFTVAYRDVKVLDTAGNVRAVPLSEVKAIFFVKDHDGNRFYRPSHDYGQDSPKAGQAVKVTFPDGEIMRGRVINMAPGANGFFLFPADPDDNNLKVFIVREPGTRVEVEA